MFLRRIVGLTLLGTIAESKHMRDLLLVNLETVLLDPARVAKSSGGQVNIQEHACCSMHKKTNLLCVFHLLKSFVSQKLLLIIRSTVHILALPGAGGTFGGGRGTTSLHQAQEAQQAQKVKILGLSQGSLRHISLWVRWERGRVGI